MDMDFLRARLFPAGFRVLVCIGFQMAAAPLAVFKAAVRVDMLLSFRAIANKRPLRFLLTVLIVDMRFCFRKVTDQFAFLIIAAIVMLMDGNPFSLFHAAEPNGFLLIAGSAMGMGLDLRQRADPGSGFIETVFIMGMNDEIRITAAQIVVIVITVGRMLMDCQRAVYHGGTACVFRLVAGQLPGNNTLLRVDMLFFSAYRLPRFGDADDPKLPEYSSSHHNCKDTEQAQYPFTACFALFPFFNKKQNGVLH